MLLGLDSALSFLNTLTPVSQPRLSIFQPTVHHPTGMVIFLLSKSDRVIFSLKISQLLYRNKLDYSSGFINWSLLSHQSHHFSPPPPHYLPRANFANWCFNAPWFFLTSVFSQIIFSLSMILCFLFSLTHLEKFYSSSQFQLKYHFLYETIPNFSRMSSMLPYISIVPVPHYYNHFTWIFHPSDYIVVEVKICV